MLLFSSFENQSPHLILLVIHRWNLRIHHFSGASLHPPMAPPLKYPLDWSNSDLLTPLNEIDDPLLDFAMLSIRSLFLIHLYRPTVLPFSNLVSVTCIYQLQKIHKWVDFGDVFIETVTLCRNWFFFVVPTMSYSIFSSKERLHISLATTWSPIDLSIY